jgi:hypothetical protein
LEDLEDSGVGSKDEDISYKEVADMYLTDIVWWGYTAFVVALILFMLFFAYKVTEKGD